MEKQLLKRVKKGLPNWALAILCMTGVLEQAQGMAPPVDLYVTVINSTDARFELCNSARTYCSPHAPGENIYFQFYTRGEAAAFLEQFLDSQVVKACGKQLPLRSMIAAPVNEAIWWDKFKYAVTNGSWGRLKYKVVIDAEHYNRECVQANEITSAPK